MDAVADAHPDSRASQSQRQNPRDYNSSVQPRLTLYAQPGYRGAARVVDQARIFGISGSPAASVEIEGGAWGVCQRSVLREAMTASR